MLLNEYVLNPSNSTADTSFILMFLPALISGIIGLIYCYYDFTETSHRLLKKTFHFGFYIFWFTWFGNCIFFMTKKSQKVEEIPQETEVY